MKQVCMNKSLPNTSWAKFWIPVSKMFQKIHNFVVSDTVLKQKLYFKVPREKQSIYKSQLSMVDTIACAKLRTS